MGNISPGLMRTLPQPVRLWAARRAVARLKHKRASPARSRGIRIPGAAPHILDRSAAPTRPAPPRAAVALVRDRTISQASPRRTDLSSLCLLAAALACSAALGYVDGRDAGGERGAGGGELAATFVDSALGERGIAPDRRAVVDADDEPLLGAALNGLRQDSADSLDDDPAMAEIGRIHAEILRLRVLFRRLADVADLEDGEFELTLEPFDLPSVRGVTDGLDLSIRALDPISTQSELLAAVFDERRAAHDRRIGGEVAPGTVRSSGFGPRPSPLGGVRRELHRGVDFAGKPGTPILALADGIVTWSGLNGGYGNLVELDHGDGLRTRYAHNQSNLVARGGRVRKGQSIALMGSTGRSTGSHVHVEVRQDGVPLDPAPYLR